MSREHKGDSLEGEKDEDDSHQRWKVLMLMGVDENESSWV